MLINLRMVLVQITRKMQQKDDTSSSFLKDLICWLSGDIKAE